MKKVLMQMRDTIHAENCIYQLKGAKNSQTKSFQYLRKIYQLSYKLNNLKINGKF